MNSDIQDTLSLLAEAYTMGEDEMVEEAIDIYNQLIQLKSGKPNELAELYIKISQLYTLIGEY